MDKTTVKKSELLEKVTANRAKHIEQYADSVNDYKALALVQLDDAVNSLKSRIGELKAGQVMQLGSISFSLKVPEDHTTDYDRTILMLQMSVDETIEISCAEFESYVMDRWDWKRNWEALYFLNKTARSTVGAR